jgi:MOSC domain-containing protein YiiM
MTGTILQINTSRGGIPKRPVPEGDLTAAGIAGDSWAHPNIHGGPNQSVLLIASESIDALRTKGYPVYPGALGENLTTQGLDPEHWCAGQRYRVGETVIELTKLRSPCNTLNIYGPAIKKEIRDTVLCGFYAKVIRPGLIFPGNVISLLSELA